MRAVILDAATMGEDIDFSPIFDIAETTVYKNTSPDEAMERIKDAEIAILNKVVLDERILSEAKNLKLICVFAIGFNNIDVEYCRKHSIRVRNVPGYCIESVCQHTFALLFALTEHLRYYDDYVKNGSYSKSGVANHMGMPFNEIAGQKWGIIGMGAIGRSVADCAAAFGAEVRYTSISGAKRSEKYPEISLDALLSESDIISIHAPLNEKTSRLIGKNELSKMKKTAVIINVGRGAIIDEEALAEAIDKGVIGGAAIDVFTEEPPCAESAIMNVKNTEKIVYSPHIAWSSVQARARCVSMTADNIRTFMQGEEHNDVWR